MSEQLHCVESWPSWELRQSHVALHVTETGGHLAPAHFKCGDVDVQPFHIAPWVKGEFSEQPNILQVLRGDFFCAPFGGNNTPHLAEEHPPHGESANAKWHLMDHHEGEEESHLHVKMDYETRMGQVHKHIRLLKGHNAIYQRHVMTDFEGNMPIGHHATLNFPEIEGRGWISTSEFIHGQVYINPTESPANKGYSILEPGSKFDALDHVQRTDGQVADLSRYPARKGYEDIAIMVANPNLEFAWTAVAFPEQGYLWFALKDPKVLRSTLLWMSNGGRHYPPWNGRHQNVLALEEITGFFHDGLSESLQENELNQRGFPTSVHLSKEKSTTVNYIMGCIAIPREFTHVRDICLSQNPGHVRICDKKGVWVETQIDCEWLKGQG